MSSSYKMIIIVIVIMLIFVNLQAFAKIDAKNVVGMWLFEEGGGDIAKDSSEKGNHGNIAGRVKWVKGKFGNAMEFNGTDTWVEVPFNDSLVLEEVTIVAWAKIQKAPRWQSILMRGQNPRNYLLCTNIDTGVLLFSMTKGAKDAWSGPSGGNPVTDDSWHHLAGVLGQKEGNVIYIDGKKVGQQAYGKPSLDADPKNIRIADGSGGGHMLQGLLDEVALFGIGLNEDQINAVMNNGLEKETGLKGALVESKGKITTVWGAIRGN